MTLHGMAVSWTTAGLLIASAAAGGGQAPAAPKGVLAGTTWRLVEIQSMDEAVGTKRPADPSLYTMRLDTDGTVHMRLNCNRAHGSWSVEPSADSSNGRFGFGPLATTRALCPPPSLDEVITAQVQYVRGYLLKDGRLSLTLMADSGLWVWEPVTAHSFETASDPQIEAAILKATPSYTRAVVDAAGGPGKDRYVYARVDLNGDGKDEVLVYTLGSFFCGSGGCGLLLFARGNDGYSLVNEFAITQSPVVVSDRKTAGWSDLFRLEAGGGASASYVRHAFDGNRYVEKGRTPGTQAPPGKVLFGDDLAFEKGIPLEPQS